MSCTLIVTVTHTDGHQRQHSHDWPGTAQEACDRRYWSLRDYGSSEVTRDGNTLHVHAPGWKTKESGVVTESLAFHDDDQPTPERTFTS